MTSNYIMNEPQRDVGCFRNLAHGHAAPGAKVDHSGHQILREGHSGSPS